MIPINKLEAGPELDALVCLNRQVVYRDACQHNPRHESIAELIVTRFPCRAPKDIQECVRRGCVRGPRLEDLGFQSSSD